MNNVQMYFHIINQVQNIMCSTRDCSPAGPDADRAAAVRHPCLQDQGYALTKNVHVLYNESCIRYSVQCSYCVCIICIYIYIYILMIYTINNS